MPSSWSRWKRLFLILFNQPILQSLQLSHSPTHIAHPGENDGELARHTYDIWTYEGRANELLTLKMIADNPPTTRIAHADRVKNEALDTILILIAPDGSQLALADDGIAGNNASPFDALIENVRLPFSGEYRIEARSLWDVGSGGYTLHLDSREITVSEELLQTYVGEYIHQDLNGLLVTIYLEAGTAMYNAQSYGLYEMRPLNETEFMVGVMRLTFLLDGNGNVAGYDIVGRSSNRSTTCGTRLKLSLEVRL